MTAETEEEQATRARRRRLPIALLVVALAAAAIAVWVGTRTTDRLEEARALAAPRHFETSLGAGEALAEIGGLLLAEGRDCRRQHGPDDPRCAGMLAASGYAQVLAAHVLRCTAPGRFEARQHIEALLDALASDREGPATQAPPLPDCS